MSRGFGNAVCGAQPALVLGQQRRMVLAGIVALKAYTTSLSKAALVDEVARPVPSTAMPLSCLTLRFVLSLTATEIARGVPL